MVMACKGMAKLAEECCELGQVAAKAIQVGGLDQHHWSGSLRHGARREVEVMDIYDVLYELCKFAIIYCLLEAACELWDGFEAFNRQRKARRAFRERRDD